MALPTFEQLENSIQSAVALGTGLAGSNVRWGYQSDPNTYAANATYAMLTITSSQQGTPEYSQTTGGSPTFTVTQTATSELLLEVEVQVFNYINTGINTSFAVCNRLASYLQLETTTDTLDLACITLQDVGAIQHIPKLLQTRYQDRSVMIITCRTLISSSSVALPILHIDGETTVNATDGSHTHHPF